MAGLLWGRDSDGLHIRFSERSASSGRMDD